MGYFSWMTSDTHESISNADSSRGALPVKMLMPDGSVHEERAYEGYGVFGGVDFYQAVHALTDDIPYQDANRGKGIGYSESRGYRTSSGSIIIRPRLVSIGFEGGYDSVFDSKSCPDQGFFYAEECEQIMESMRRGGV